MVVMSCMLDKKIGNVCSALKRVSGIAIASGVTTSKEKINATLVEARLMSGDMSNNPDAAALPFSQGSKNLDDKLPNSLLLYH